MNHIKAEQDLRMFRGIADKADALDIELEMLNAAWRVSEAEALPVYGSVIADDETLRWIEEQARSGK